MKNVFIFLFFLSITLCNLSSAGDITPIGLQRAPGKVNCNEEAKICSYVAQNITGRELIAKLNANLFPGSILSPSEGYITNNGIKEINFYVYNESIRLKLSAAIPLLDTLESFDPSDLILLTTEVYTLSEGGLTNIQASLVTANASNSDLADWSLTSIFGSSTGMALKIGTNLLSSLLGSNKVKNESSRVTTISQLIPNQSGIGYSNTSKVYISPGTSGVVKEEQAGINLGGTVSISARDNDLVLIKDYSFSYGVVEVVDNGTPIERVNILNVTNPQLYLVKGTSSLVVSSVTMDQSHSTDYSVVSYGNKKLKSLRKVMIVTRAESVNFKDFVADMKKLGQLELHQTFSKEEKAKFPNDDIKIEEVLSNIKPNSFFTTSGDRVLTFKIDKTNARLNNISKNIEVSIKSGTFFSPGIKQKVILPLENLMLSGVRLDPLSHKEMSESIVNINITLKVYDSNESISKTLHYNPETNKFF